jgi:hypothetical protein
MNRPPSIGQKAQPAAAGRQLKTAEAVTTRGAGSGPRPRAAGGTWKASLTTTNYAFANRGRP